MFGTEYGNANAIPIKLVPAAFLVHDFSQSEGDKIDLSPLNPNNPLGGQSFVFKGADIFNIGFIDPPGIYNWSGQVRFVIDDVNNKTTVEILLGGVSDSPPLPQYWKVELTGEFQLTAADFIL